jgi:hypothetical protein
VLAASSERTTDLERRHDLRQRGRTDAKLPLRSAASRRADVNEASIMQLAKYVKFREEKFGGVLFETRSEKVFTLNPTATAVVREIQVGGDEPAIVGRLKDRFGDGSAAIERDVAALIADLRQRGLVEG